MDFAESTLTGKDLMAYEDKYGAHNYHPLPVVLARGEGVYVWDVEGKRYYDFLSAYSALNQGHCHPKIVQALKQQAETLTLTSRAFYNDMLGLFEKYVTEFFGYDKVLPMNTGAEAVETAIKICRKWAHDKRGVAADKGKIVVFDQNFHGRTTTIISFSSDPVSRNGFGPFAEGFLRVDYDNIQTLEEIFAKEEDIIGVLVEPIQGEAGVIVPGDEFMPALARLCKENNALLIADEIQTGIGRTGALLTSSEDSHGRPNGVRADMIILGKALAGGVYPVSAVLADDHIMEVMTPGTHGSTFGGNPLGARVAMVALEVIKEEGLIENANRLGTLFREKMNELIHKTSLISLVRGRGLLNAIVINDTPESKTAWNLCLQLRDNGLLAKPTHGNIVRFAPPLVMDESQLLDCCHIIEKSVLRFS